MIEYKVMVEYMAIKIGEGEREPIFEDVSAWHNVVVGTYTTEVAPSQQAAALNAVFNAHIDAVRTFLLGRGVDQGPVNSLLPPFVPAADDPPWGGGSSPTPHLTLDVKEAALHHGDPAHPQPIRIGDQPVCVVTRRGGVWVLS